jgi:UDP-GlcNAc:undecaprenyl-phosphate/decaprenyl-phosphate GlcNAc-1-phosphate transferase
MTTIKLSLITLFVAWATTVLIIPWVKKFSHRIGILDQPESRKVHTNPTPRLGGVGIYFGFVVSSLLVLPIDKLLITIIAGGTLILILGIWDDVKSISPLIKLAFQIAIAGLTYYFGISIHWISAPDGGFIFLQWLSIPLTIFWIVGLINAINLLDGLDGLAGGIAAIAACILAFVAIQHQQFLVATLMIALLGSCLGFLKFNFSNAQVFMGDSGSMFLGYILACVSVIGVLKSTVTFALLIPILIFAVPISDTLFSIIRRFRKKQPLFKADNGHYHHRLLELGLTAKQITILSYVISGLLGIIAIFMSQSSGISSYILLAVSVGIISASIVLCRKRSPAILSIVQFFL